jgi:hypothetical protein
VELQPHPAPRTSAGVAQSLAGTGRHGIAGPGVGDGAIVVFLERKRIGHFLFTAVFATSVLLLLILLKMLDYPFEGALTLSSADFVKTIERVSTTMGGV